MRRIIAVFLFLFTSLVSHSQKECSQSIYNSRITAVASPVASTNAPVPVTASAEGIQVPVVVHILSNGKGAPVTDEQVQSQIDALNRDFNAQNADLANIPIYFKRVAARVGIRFVLAKVDPSGKPTTGIVRRETSIQTFTLDDRIKFRSKGGDDAWPRDHYLNIWVGPMLSAIHGYSSQPGSAPEIDGVVINSEVFGTLNKRGSYSKGRIAVHELGHWLGLKHIWGDNYCGDDDIDDTPQQKSYNRGCPSGNRVSCGSGSNGDMYMNFMDMTDDACMFMFTEGQKRKMLSVFAPGSPRAVLLNSGALLTDGKPIDPAWGQQTVAAPEKSLTVFPVPATRELRVDIHGPLDRNKRMVVYNMTGQVMMTVEAAKSQVQLDISSLKSGQYILKMENSSASAAAKFVKL
ncbi:T9SS type A sorting domain-containing protein [Flavihumibacter solisilvae]|uniref:T9SS type A sorting domain-containing protein n=1 Tax=Flavihumibacter solisilvae TaxID=1349421 RepID=UPI00068F3B0D|nr:T9SS type A sorting domain-containing protein [Flavihumibacter solisilvae]